MNLVINLIVFMIRSFYFEFVINLFTNLPVLLKKKKLVLINYFFFFRINRISFIYITFLCPLIKSVLKVYCEFNIVDFRINLIKTDKKLQKKPLLENNFPLILVKKHILCCFYFHEELKYKG